MGNFGSYVTEQHWIEAQQILPGGPSSDQQQQYLNHHQHSEQQHILNAMDLIHLSQQQQQQSSGGGGPANQSGRASAGWSPPFIFHPFPSFIYHHLFDSSLFRSRGKTECLSVPLRLLLIRFKSALHEVKRDYTSDSLRVDINRELTKIVLQTIKVGSFFGSFQTKGVPC